MKKDDDNRGCPTISNLLLGHSAWALQYINPRHYLRCEQQLRRNPFYLDYESFNLKDYLEETMNQVLPVHKRFSLELIYDVSMSEHTDIEMIIRKSVGDKRRPRILEWGDALMLKIFQYLDLDAFEALAQTCRYMYAQSYAYIICKSSTAIEHFTPWYYKGVFRFTHVKPFNQPLSYIQLHTSFIHSVSTYIYCIYIYIYIEHGHYREIISLIESAKELFKGLIKNINIHMASIHQEPIDIKGYFKFVTMKFVSTPYRNEERNKRPIIQAIEESYLNVTQLLIENGAKLKGKYKGLQGKNALEIAIISRNIPLLKIVLEGISQLRVKDGYDSFNKEKKIFELAVDHLNMEGIELLLKHYTPKAQNKRQTMQSISLGICRAIINKRKPVVDIFIKNKIGINIIYYYCILYIYIYIDPNELVFKDKSVLMVATKYGYLDIVDEILELPSTNVHVVNSKGWSALHYSARYANQACLAQLLRFGANVDKFTYDGDSALSIAFKRGENLVVIKELLCYANNIMFQRMNTLGVFPLVIAKQYIKDEKTIEQIIELEDKCLDEAYLKKEVKKMKKEKKEKNEEEIPNDLMKLQRKLKVAKNKKMKNISYQYEFKNLKFNIKRRNSLSTLYADPIKKEKKIQLGESTPKYIDKLTDFQQNMYYLLLYLS